MKNILLPLFTVLFGITLATQACAAEPPVDMIRETTKQVLELLKKDDGKNSPKIREQVENLVLPKFDFKRMTALALGKNWRAASPEQQDELVVQFQTLLTRTYASTMTRFKNAQVDIKPNTTFNNDGQEAVVHSDISLPSNGDKKPVSVDYILYKTAQGWKVYNISVEGASLVTVYRTQFDSDIKTNGIDGLIMSLKDKNANKAG